MMKTVPSIAAIAAAAACLATAGTPAAPTDAIAKDPPHLTEKERMISEDGGIVERDGVSRGVIAFVDTQTAIPHEDVAAAMRHLETPAFKFKYKTVLLEEKPGEAGALKKKTGAELAVIVMDDASAPALLVAPEDGWAQVNVAKMGEGLKSEAAKEKFFRSRCRKEILRAVAAVSGGLCSNFPGNVMDVTKVADLDACKEFLPFDTVQKMKAHLRNSGFAPRQTATYYAAAYKGWAPAPTNDLQKILLKEAQKDRAEREAAKAAKAKADKERGPTNPITIPPPRK